MTIEDSGLTAPAWREWRVRCGLKLPYNMTWIIQEKTGSSLIVAARMDTVTGTNPCFGLQHLMNAPGGLTGSANTKQAGSLPAIRRGET